MTAPFGDIEHDPQAVHDVPWNAPGIGRAVGLLFADAFGYFGSTRQPTRVEAIDGRTCLVGGFICLDVDVEDIDGTVELELVVDGATTPWFLIGYDASGTPENKRRVDLPPGDERWATVVVPLERARFAGRGPRGTDILLGAPAGDFGSLRDPTDTLVFASIRLSTSGADPASTADAFIELDVRDETSAPAAARFGLYDTQGREVLPSDDAIPVPRYGEVIRQLPLRSISAVESGPGGIRETWPHDGRWVSYLDGTYRVSVPAGSYDLVITKGPEYRWVTRRLSVEPGETCRARVDLERWADLPSRGWHAGDAHIHMRRDPVDDRSILAIARAEDLQIANMLQMGNVGNAYFPQHAFGREGQASIGDVHLVSGQEDPRTGQRGHTLHLNVATPIRDPDRYFLYHETFERLRAGGALSGYAHVDSGWFSDELGLALDVPFGLVDLVEILQAGALHLDQWYDFLNLGYRLVPVAGSDWPYIDLPGTVRSYVHVAEDLTVERWFDGLRAGRTFVTSGPMLQLDVDGVSMGDELPLTPGSDLTVRAEARQGPDLGSIERLELIVHGEVVATGVVDPDGSASIEHRLSPTAGCWVAVRAAGATGTWAHSAPVYIPAAGATWNADAAPEIVERMRGRLSALLAADPDPQDDLEPWDGQERYVERWQRLLPELTARVEEANRRYGDLLDRIERSTT